MLVASPMKMNVLYRGVRNPIAFSVPGVTPENLRPVITNGAVQRDGNSWFATVNTLGTTRLSAQVTLPDGSTRTVASVNGLTATDAKASLRKLKAAQGITIKRSEGCEFDEPYAVREYTVAGMVRGNPVDHTVHGAAFDEETRKLLNALRPGDRVWFENIKAQLANGAGPRFALPAMNWKTVN